MNGVTKLVFLSSVFTALVSYSAFANARYAAIVIDADSGRVVHEVEATHRWYPASLTKVMTMYLTFAALEAGRLHLHDSLTVSAHAARQPSSKLGLRQGQHIDVEQAIMAVTTRSANDAVVVLAERLGGSEANFADMMTQQARSMGMYNSSFQNASGLPDEQQISSARDLALLSSALIRDFPQYYRYFSMTEFAYKGRMLTNTNKILKTYPDADGLKTGFTCGSGYNLIASAKRNGKRLIGVLLGAHSSEERFRQMANLLDLGFEKSQQGISGLPVAQMRDANFEPPPFQLSSNRCAGSAAQMGADSGSGRHEPIRIPSAKPAPARHDSKAAARPLRVASHADWSIMLGDFSRKADADTALRHARSILGTHGGKSQVVRVRAKGKTFWRGEWMGLLPGEARAMCKKLQNKKRDCSLLPGRA